MSEIRVNPTRMELTRQKRRLAMAVRGHKLLKDKRDEMVRQFVLLARKNMELRKNVEQQVSGAMLNFMLASAVMTKEQLDQALLYPSREVELEISKQNIMSVNVPKLEVKEIREAEGGTPYGYAFTTAELDEAITLFSQVLPELIRLAETEKACSMLADEIEKTRRRVNALEYVLIPRMQETIKFIKMKIDENERGNITRLMKTKEMIAKRDA